MPHPRKFSDIELADRLRQGKRITEIAQEFGVNKASVCRRAKRLKAGIATNSIMHHSDEMAGQQIRANEQIFKINKCANAWLDRFEAMRDRKQEGVIAGIGARITELLPAAEAEEIVRQLAVLIFVEKDVVDQVIKLLAEIRQQMRFLFEVHKDMVDAREFKEFKDSFLAEIGLVNLEVRERIIERLQKLQAMRSSIGWPEAGRFNFEASHAA